MKRRMLLSVGLIVGAMGALPTCVGGEDAPAFVPANGPKALQDFSVASQELYKKVSGGLVRVRMENAAGLGVTPQLQKEFEEWRREQVGRGPAREARPDHRPDAPAATMPARTGGGVGGGGGGMGLRRFLEQKLKDSPDAETQTRVRAILARMDAARNGQANDVTGVVIDDQGHTLVAWARGNTGTTFRVIAADGTETGAKYVGSHLGRGIAVLKLDNMGTQAPLAMAGARPAGGELLMCLTVRQGAVGWVLAPAQPPASMPAASPVQPGSASASSPGNTPPAAAPAAKKPSDERFAIFGDDEHGASYLFNTSGELAAIGMEKYAVPIEGFKSDINWIIENNKDISPKALGVNYTAVLPEMRQKWPALGTRPGALVAEVVKGSLAEKAGLKKDDIVVSIDDISIGLLPRIQADLATRTGNVPMDIFRGGTEMTLELPLGEK